MFSIDFHRVINTIVDHEFQGKGGREGEALHFHLDLRMEHRTKQNTHRVSRGLHLLYYCSPGYTSVSVFSGTTLSPFGNIGEVIKWKHETTHDSCWRDVRVFTELYFSMADEVIRHFPMSKKLCPNDLDEYNNFALFQKLYRWVPVEIKKDPADKYNYRRTITLKGV